MAKPQIRIKHPGALTRKAKAVGKSPRAFANQVMSAKKGTYSAQTRRQANFAKVAATWKKPKAGSVKAKAAGRKAAMTRSRRRR